MSWSKEDWREHVLANKDSSYGLITLAAGMLLAENPDKDPHELCSNNINGLSGYQFEMAKKIANEIAEVVGE